MKNLAHPKLVAPRGDNRPGHTTPTGRHRIRSVQQASISTAVLAALFAVSALGAASNSVQRLPLNPNVVVSIPVATNRLTTVRFPGAISGLEATLVSTEPHPDSRFLLSFEPGQDFFSLRATGHGVNATLNVIWNHQTYVLELVESVARETPPPRGHRSDDVLDHVPH